MIIGIIVHKINVKCMCTIYMNALRYISSQASIIVHAHLLVGSHCQKVA